MRASNIGCVGMCEIFISASWYPVLSTEHMGLKPARSGPSNFLEKLDFFSMSRTHQSNVIYQSAMAYHRLAVIAMDNDSILVTSPMAIVANLALCVELLLKATDAKVTLSPTGEDGPIGQAAIGSKVWGHDLVDIFSKIEPELQVELSQLFEEGTGKPLLPLLEKCKDYFIHARYYYEPKHHHGFDISAIRMLAEGLSTALWKGWGPGA